MKQLCPDCEVSVGEFHLPGCDWEDCPYCGLQLLGCEHGSEGDGVPMDDCLRWDGMRKMERAALEYGFYAIMGAQGWTPCPKDTPNCVLDLNRVLKECEWNRAEKKFVLGSGRA